GVAAASDWERLAIESIVDDSYGHQSALTNRVLEVAGGGKLGPRAAEGVITTWIESHNGAVERTCQVLDSLRESETVDLAMLTVANGQLRGLLAS
ncbi:MAG: NAD-glutamate dehydrogenase, partial [Alphaproteobacteria bacterium]